MANGGNNGLNDIEVYCQTLKTEDFARYISNTLIPSEGVTYGEYLDVDDTVEVVREHIRYNIHRNDAALTVGFVDSDPLVASQMLDSVTHHLQTIITSYRQSVAKAAVRDAQERFRVTKERYLSAQKRYSAFADSHQNTVSGIERQEENALSKEVDLAYQDYKKATTQLVRQMSLAKRNYMSFAVIKSNTVPLRRNGYFLSYLLPFLLIAITAVKGMKLYKKRKQEQARIEFGGIFSPWTITILVWLGIAFLFAIYGDKLYPVTRQFYISIVLWLTVFLSASFLTFNLMEHKTVPTPQDGVDVNRYFFYFFFVIAVILSPMYLYEVWKIVSMFDSKDMMSNVRLLSIYGDSMGSLYYALVLAPALLMIALWRYPKMPRWQLVVIIMCCIINGLAIMEKGTFFIIILCSIYVLYQRGKIRFGTIGIVLGIMVLLFFAFNIFRVGEDTDYAKNETLLDFIAMYVMSPPVAYCTVTEEISDVFGSNSLSIFYALLSRLGIANVETGGKLQEFVYVPVLTNVYTIMQPFFKDFGQMGVAFFAFLYGLLHGYLYRLSQNGNVFGICLYTYEVHILILQFYQENIFVSGMYFLLLSLVIYLCTQQRVSFCLHPKPV